MGRAPGRLRRAGGSVVGGCCFDQSHDLSRSFKDKNSLAITGFYHGMLPNKQPSGHLLNKNYAPHRQVAWQERVESVKLDEVSGFHGSCAMELGQAIFVQEDCYRVGQPLHALKYVGIVLFPQNIPVARTMPAPCFRVPMGFGIP